jgi:hypothetical protein
MRTANCYIKEVPSNSSLVKWQFFTFLEFSKFRRIEPLGVSSRAFRYSAYTLLQT